MNRVKLRFLAILSFFAVLALAAGIVFAATPLLRTARAQTYAPTTVFSAGTGGTIASSAAEEGETSYVEFTLRDDGRVHYRRDLALKWFDGADSARYLSFAFSFPQIGFETFEISFESAEENVSKDGKATNSLVFFNNDGALQVAVKDAANTETQNGELTKVDLTAGAGDDIAVRIAEGNGCDIGEFEVFCNEVSVGKFTNVGGYFMEYRSSASSTPNTPITFSAELPQGTAEQKVLMKELNGQTFEIDENGNVVDNAGPVLVLNEEIYAMTLGQRFNLTYEAIDVCDDTVAVSRSYYMLKTEDGQPVKPDEANDGEDYKTLTSSTYFLPTSDLTDEEVEYVSIRFRLDDGTRDPVFTYLTWYAADSAVQEMGEGENAFDYIVLNREKAGPHYIGITPTPEAEVPAGGTGRNETSAAFDAAVEAYQRELNEAARDLSAGTGAYIYLPSFRGLIASDYADYRNLRFNIYYYRESASENSSASSQTSLRYNALRLEVDQIGLYRFRVMAADAAGNNTKLWLDGELVDVTASNIWEFDEIPDFYFEVGYTGATVEDAGEQDYGYRDSTYRFDSFQIVALRGYGTEYTLYHFGFPEGENVPEYSEFVENLQSYMENDRYAESRTTIREYDSRYSEDDAAWDRTDNDYHWNPSSSLSFVPQETGYYVLEVLVTDPNLPGHVVSAYQAINVRNPIDTIPGQSRWLEDNVVSVVLFSISAVLAVVIVVLFVVKPSEKKVEDVDLEALKGNKKKNKKS